MIQRLNLTGNQIVHEIDLRNLLFGITQNISLVELKYDQEFISQKGQLHEKELELINHQLKLNQAIA